MKTLIQFIIKLVCVIAGIFILSIITESCINTLSALKTDKHISLPEEIQLAEQGNLLLVEEVSQDTVELGYNQVKFDYYMQLNRDTIYLIDKSGNTIHKEQMNWKTPNKLQLALIKDNL